MKKYSVLLAIIFVISITINLNAQVIWTGPITTFTKADNADWTLEANQDRITSNVWITRKSTQSIFNIVSETGSTTISPSGTEWAIGTTAEIGTLTFDNFITTHGGNPSSILNQDMVLHLITDNIYIDIKFTSYSGGGPGGGFSYERSTDQNLSIAEIESSKKVRLFPNPSSNFITISGSTEPMQYEIYNLLGTRINYGSLSDDNKIDIQSLTKGLYIMKFSNGMMANFIKQ